MYLRYRQFIESMLYTSLKFATFHFVSAQYDIDIAGACSMHAVLNMSVVYGMVSMSCA